MEEWQREVSETAKWEEEDGGEGVSGPGGVQGERRRLPPDCIPPSVHKSPLQVYSGLCKRLSVVVILQCPTLLVL